jgi:hypothetical protein
MAPDPPESSDAGLANHLSPVRALLVLAGFLVAVGVLVAVGTRPSVSGEGLNPQTTTTTVAGHGTGSTTTTTTIPPGSVKVVVANATSTHALAAHYSTALAKYGWAMQVPADSSAHLATSAVYYATGQQEPAAAIAVELGLKPSAVLPLTTAVPVTGVSGDSVVVVIGSDLVAASGL